MVYDMKKALMICAVMFTLAAMTANAQETFCHKWDVGLSMGFGMAKNDEFRMNAELGYSRRIGESKWRWGIAAGIMNPGIVDYDYGNEATEDFFRYHSYQYLLGYVDYAVLAGKEVALYLHGGIAPCQQRDLYQYHHEDIFSALTQFGIGMDAGGYVRMSLMGFAAFSGEVGGLLSIGFFFGKR